MCGPGSRNSREAQPRRGTPSRRGVAGRVERPEDLSSPLGSSMATLSQSRPTAGHRSQQLQQQTSRPRALQQCQSVLLLLRHGLDHEVPAGFIAGAACHRRQMPEQSQSRSTFISTAAPDHRPPARRCPQVARPSGAAGAGAD